MSNRYKLIHIQEKQGGALYPLIVKSYKTKKMSKGKPLVLGRKELMKNMKHIKHYGGWLAPLLGALAPTLINEAVVPAFSWAKKKIFGSGLNAAGESPNIGYNPNDIPRTEVTREEPEPFVSKVAKHSVLRKLKYRKGGRIFLGSGIKKLGKMTFEGPFETEANDQIIPELKGIKAETYRLKANEMTE